MKNVNMEVHFPTLNKWRSSCFQRQDKSPEKAASVLNEKGVVSHISETDSTKKGSLSFSASQYQRHRETTTTHAIPEEEKPGNISVTKKAIIGAMAALGFFGSVVGAIAVENKEDAQLLLHPPSQSIVIPSFEVSATGAYNNVSIQEKVAPLQPKVAVKINAPDNIFGIDNEAWKKLSEDITLNSVLLSMPKEVASIYNSTSLGDKKKINEKLHGKTTILFLTIDNKEALVNGTIIGRDVFKMMKNYIDKSLRQNKLTKEEADLRKRAIELFRPLNTAQRKALIRLLEMDLTTIGAAKAAT